MTRDLESNLQPAIDEERIASNWQHIARGRAPARTSRRPLRWTFAIAATAAAAVTLYLAWPSRGGPLTAVDVAIAPGSVVDAPARRAVALDDGSALELASGARVQVLTNEADRFVMLLIRGRAHFDVHPGGPRRWEIETSRATVEVVGTAFSVESDDRRVVVEVDHGVVMVRGERVPGRVARLVAGERLAIDDASTKLASGSGTPATARAGAATPADGAPAGVPTVSPPATPMPSAASGVGTPAHAPAAAPTAPATPGTAGPIGAAAATRGASTTSARPADRTTGRPGGDVPTPGMRTAPAIRSQPGVPPVGPNARPPSQPGASNTARPRTEQHAQDPPPAAARGTAESKKLAAILGDADQRRASGDAAGAAALLEETLATTRDDPSIGLAEFTLGRLYLEDLGAPDRAAAAFAKMIAVGSPHALLEDAYGRRIEALARARRTDEARAALAEYDRLYPHGLRRTALHALVP